MLEYTKYRREATKNKEKNIDTAIKLLKPHLKKGDLLITKPNLSSIKIKLFNLPSYFISLFSKGMTHSTIYDGKGNVVDLDFRLKDSLKKITLRDFLRSKYRKFKGITVYTVQPRRYTSKNRSDVERVLDGLLKKSKEIGFSVRQYFSMLYWAIVKGIRYDNIYKLKYKQHNLKKTVCSALNAYILKMGGVKIGGRPLVSFLPSTFVFSKYFKIKKKIKV